MKSNFNNFKIKIFFSLFLFIFCVFTNANAQVIPYGANFRPVSVLDKFSIKYLPSKEMSQVFPNKKGAELPVHRTYIVEKGKYEIWYTLFAEIKKTEKPNMAEFLFYMLNCASLVAGRNILMSEMTVLNEQDLKETFNADFGCFCFLQMPNSAYAKGFAYVQLQFFYKIGKGFVMRAFLTNNLKTLTIPAKSYKNAFNSFKFEN